MLIPEVLFTNRELIKINKRLFEKKITGDNNKLLFEKLDVINKKIVKHEERLQFVEKTVKDLEESLTVCKDIDGEKMKNIEKKMVTIQ